MGLGNYFLNLVGAQAPRANLNPADFAVDLGANALQVGFPSPFGPVERVGNVISHLRVFLTNNAFFRHECFLLVIKNQGANLTWQPVN